MSGQMKSMSYFVVRQNRLTVGKTTYTKDITMNRNKEREWQKDPSCITANFEENVACPEEEFIPFVDKDILERYLENQDEPSDFFKGAILSFFVCVAFWTILIFLIT
jgi:hypothetical protein